MTRTNATSPTPASQQWRHMFRFVRPYWPPLLLSGLARMLTSGMFLALPVIIRGIVDSALEADSMNRLNEQILMLMGGLGVMTLGGMVGHYYQSYVGERVINDVRRALYAHLQSLSLCFFTEQRVGDLISRISDDANTMRRMLTTDLLQLTRQAVTITGGIIVMVLLNWRLTVFIIIVTPLMIVLILIISRLTRPASRKMQDTKAVTAAVAAEVFQNPRDVKSFVREAYEVGRYNRTMDDALGAALQLVRIRSVLWPLMDLLLMLDFALITWYGGREVLAGRLTTGELVAFVVYAAVVGQGFAALATLFAQFQETLGASGRVFELLATQPDVQDAADATALDTAAGRITFEDVTFAYDERQAVLQQIDLNIAPGEILALVGPSGAGKSTVFNLIPRFYDVTGGVLRVDRHDVRAVTQASLRAQIGIVPQETLLFGGTIRENILYGRLDATEAEIIAAAEAANAHTFILEQPDGYDALVGERGVKLSGGQRQRVAIARAILKDPRILLLDEATSSLDNESEHLVQEALERLMQGRTTVIIAHRLSTVRVAHRIAVLDAGRIAELGTHDDLMTQAGLYARLYEMQFREADLLARNGTMTAG
ncbi:MAG: ATP-binding cassette domain-containing protein [Anaerolineae bacterium]|nr:ATP-binding cassette domain-containing protein [Anaerolineae bacterium]